MIAPSIKTLIASALLSGLIFAAPVQAATAAAALSKADVEKIVEDYILAHPETILKSVDDFQQRSLQEHQTTAVKNNSPALFEDETTPFIGNAKGDVVLVEFFDYNCGYCKKAFHEMKELTDSDKNLKIMFKDFPILGPTSETSSKWALAAHKQNKYFEYHTQLMQNRQPITDELLAKIAKDVGMDVAKAKQDAESTDVLIQIEKNRTLATQMGLSGTPAFVIGKEVIAGVATTEQLRAKIDEVRKAAKK